MEHKDYQKINTIYKRDQDGRLIFGDWSLPEFEFLKDCKFRAEEKIDGTNIHVRFNGVRVEFGGRTTKANIPFLQRTRMILIPHISILPFMEKDMERKYRKVEEDILRMA